MKTLLKTIRGSQVYGTAIKTSDTDYFSLYKLPVDDYLKLSFKEQIDHNKDDTSIEIGRFIHLLTKSSPIQIELLFTPNQYYVEYDKSIELLLQHKDKFLTKQLKFSYLGFINKQLSKAKNITHRLDWEQNEVPRKNVLDFCYLVTSKGTILVEDWIEDLQKMYPYNTNLSLNNLIATKLNHTKEGHKLYLSPQSTGGLGTDESNNIRVSETPINWQNLSYEEIGVMLYNPDAYSSHCKKYKEYIDWLEKRNPERYKAIKETGSIVDLKFFYHTIRLINTCIELFTEGTIIVDRRSRDAEYLLKIRRGEVSLEELNEYVETKLVLIEELYSKCTLPETIDMEFVNNLVVEMRK